MTLKYIANKVGMNLNTLKTRHYRQGMSIREAIRMPFKKPSIIPANRFPDIDWPHVR